MSENRCEKKKNFFSKNRSKDTLLLHSPVTGKDV